MLLMLLDKKFLIPAGIFVGAFLLSPTLALALLSLALFALSIAMLIYAGWLIIPWIPALVFIWWSWDSIVSYGFLGYWGILGVLLIPLIVMFDKLQNDHEYTCTAFAVVIWIVVPSLYGIIAYWYIAQYLLAAILCVAVVAIAVNKNISDLK